MVANSKPLRGDKRQRTRQRLVAEATRLFESQGILGTSLEQVAVAAGMSKGAIYSNFRGKESLVLAVMLDQELMLKPEIRSDMSSVELLGAIGNAVVDLVKVADPRARLISEYLLYAASSAQLKEHLSAIFSARIERLVGHVQSVDLLLPQCLNPREFVIACEVLTTGFLMHKVLLGSDIGNDEIVNAFLALAVGDADVAS